MPGTSYVKKGMVIETQDDDELTNIKEGYIINLENLLFTEKRDYLVKYNGQKVCAISAERSCTCFYQLFLNHFFFLRQPQQTDRTPFNDTTHCYI